MLRYGRTNSTDSQTIAVFPFNVITRVSAIGLHLGLVVRLENRLAGNAEAMAKVSYVLNLLPDEVFSDLRGDALEDFTSIGKRRFSPLRGGGHAKEEDFQRPRMSIRIFIVEENALVRRVIC